MALSKSARMRIRACTTIPGASEGVLPPDSKPVTSYEALYHLAKRVSGSMNGWEDNKKMDRTDELPLLSVASCLASIGQGRERAVLSTRGECHS